MKKGYKKVNAMYAIAHYSNLATICNIRNDIAMNRNESSFLFNSSIDSSNEFIEKIKSDDYITYINLSCDKQDELIEISKEDVCKFVEQSICLYYKL